jgi:ceramide glucosyltransferase
MLLTLTAYVFLAVATFPSIYYLIALYSAWRFFRRSGKQNPANASFTPPVSNLKPVRGLDPEAYENFASFCRQDYPDYELVFCVGELDDPVVPVIERLKRDFPERRIRVLFGSDRSGSNDKATKLARLVDEAEHEVLVISDSDVRVRPDYLRKVVAPLADPHVGAVTCLYVSTGEKTFADNLQTIGMVSDFYAGILVATQLDGVKFALGPTIATTREQLARFGGYQAIQNRPADDLLVGRLIAEQGYQIQLSSYAISAVSDYESIRELIHKRMRWLVVMRHMRPWGHFGLLFTQGLPWSLAAVAIHPTVAVALSYFGAYLGLRIAVTWVIGTWGLHWSGLWKKLPLITVWDLAALIIWCASFWRQSVRWRDGEYFIRDGTLVPVISSPGSE